MIKKAIVSVCCLAVCLIHLHAAGPANPPPANDNPTSGLKIIDPNDPPPSDGTSSPLVDKFHGHLIVLENGKPKPFDSAALSGVKYLAFYYSASWCPPCRVFTPKLVDFYKSFKQAHPNFELIFVDDDQDEDSMLAYMKGDNMIWPAVKFSDLESTTLKPRKYCGDGIPDLVLTDADGKVLSDSFNGQDYVGPMKVLDDIKKLVPTP